MRFHFGVSFRFKTLKKFLFPILIGVLAYFGLNFLNLGYLQVNALVNYDTNMYISYRNINNAFEQKIDSSVSIKEFFNHLNSLDSSNYKIMIANSYFTNSFDLSSNIAYLYIYLFPSSLSSLPISIYGNYNANNLRIMFSLTASNIKRYRVKVNSYTDIYSSTDYSDLYTCLTTDVCNNSNSNLSISNLGYFNIRII